MKIIVAIASMVVLCATGINAGTLELRSKVLNKIAEKIERTALVSNPYAGDPGKAGNAATAGDSAGLLETAEGMEQEPHSSALTTQDNCDACIRVVTEASDEIEAGQDLDVDTVFILFNEECDIMLSGDEELLQACYAEVEPEKTLSEEQLVEYLSYYSAREICSGHAQDYFVNFCSDIEE